MQINDKRGKLFCYIFYMVKCVYLRRHLYLSSVWQRYVQEKKDINVNGDGEALGDKIIR